MRILVTGGAGYIGSVLALYLARDDHHFTVLDNCRHGENSLATLAACPQFSVVNGDARDPAVLLPLLKDHDIIIPLAAIVGAPACARDSVAAVTTNRHAIGAICTNLSRDQRVIYPNSNSGYGVGSLIECDEHSPMNPISLYGITKADAEKVVLERENSITFRLATVFGASPRMRTDLMVNDFVLRAVTDKCITLFEANFRRNFVHVRDVARAFLHAIDNFETMKGKPYNVGDTAANLSKWQLCQKIKEHIPSFAVMRAPIGEDEDKRDYVVSNKRIEATGWQPSYTLDHGITELRKLYTMLNPRRYSNA